MHTCSFGRDQTCAMLLGLACGNLYLDCLDGIPPVTVEIVNLAKQAFYDFGERPIWAERMTYGQGMLWAVASTVSLLIQYSRGRTRNRHF